MTIRIDAIDRRHSAYRRAELERAYRAPEPHPATPAPPASHDREQPDAMQVIGIPLFIMRPPAWREQDWAQPQHAPTRSPA